MKSLAASLSTHRALGLHLGDHEIVAREVSSTLLGLRETAGGRATSSPGDYGDGLESVLRPLLGQHRRYLPPVAVGLPASRVFFATRPVRTLGDDARPEHLLQKAMQSSSLSVDELVVELIKEDVGKTPAVRLAATRRKQLVALLADLERLGIRPLRVEPAPCALVRAANRRHPAPRRTKTVLRVFLNDTEGLAVLIAGSLPIAWRGLLLPPGREDETVLSARRTLEALGKHYGNDAPLDAVMIHGRSDLHAKFRADAFVEETASRVLCCDGPALDGESIAEGLAIGCLEAGEPAFDLSRSLKPRPSIREIFPWSELTLQVALMIVMGVLLFARSMNANEAYQAIRVANTQHECLSSSTPRELEKEKKDLTAKVDAVRRFVETRVLWTSYTHDLPARLPAEAYLTSLRGLDELEYFGKREGMMKPKKSLILRATAPIHTDGLVPRDIDAFLAALRDHPLLKRDFPEVELADIKRFQLFQGAQPMANFTVVCLPKTAAPKASPGPDGEGKKGE